MKNFAMLILGLTLLATSVMGCSSGSGNDNNGNGGDADADTDAEGDGAGDADGDTDADADADADGDGDTDGDADSDAAVDGGGSDSGTDGGDFVSHFKRYTVVSGTTGPAWASVGDVNKDSKPEIIVSFFGALTDLQMKGQVIQYTRTGGLDAWAPTPIAAQNAGIKYPNQTELIDVDNDGDLDLIVPSGFLACEANPLAGACGGLVWFENTGTGWTRHNIVDPASKSVLFYHHVVMKDFDGDTLPDLVTVGERRTTAQKNTATVQMFKGTSDAVRFSTTPIDIASGMGGLVVGRDLDNDGDLDLFSAEYFLPTATFPKFSFAWLEQTVAPTTGANGGTWVRHVIANDVGPSIMFQFVDDLYGDGKLMAVGANHTNTADTPSSPKEAVYALDIPAAADLKDPWSKTQISQGIKSRKSPLGGPMGAPGIFGSGDVDDDGDIDLVVSGDGDYRVFVLEQTSAGHFATHVLEKKLGQAGGCKVVDLDGDGKNEIVVTGYEDNVVYIYKWQG